MPSSPGIGMHVEVKDPDDKIVLSRVYSSEGTMFEMPKLASTQDYFKFQAEFHSQVTHLESTSFACTRIQQPGLAALSSVSTLTSRLESMPLITQM